MTLTFSCPKFTALVSGMRRDYAQLQRLEADLQRLAAWNPKEPQVAAAGSILFASVKALCEQPRYPTLRDNEAYLACMLDTVRLALAALSPYAEEAPQADIDILRFWYDAELPAGPLPEPDPAAVPYVQCYLWEQARQLRSPDTLRETASRKGLWLLRNDVPYAERYQVVVPDRPVTSMRYQDAATLIERYRG
jgi:hypothetical protein